MNIWFVVCVLVIAWRVFDYPRAKATTRETFVFAPDYVLLTVIMSIFWPFVLPLYGILKLGEWNVARKKKS